MNTTRLILMIAAGVYALRLGGLLLPNLTAPPGWERALAFVPVAVLSALVASSLIAPATDRPLRIIAAGGGAMAAYVSGRMWACILGGVSLYWLLRLI